MNASPVEGLARALDATDKLVAGVRNEQWTALTPCTEWTVRDLVNHLVGGNQLFAVILRGQTSPSPAALRQRQGLDHLGDDPVGAYRAAGEALLGAFSEPGVLAQVVTVPIGAVPGIAALNLRVVEVLVHGWDLAQATGQPTRFPEDLVEQALDFTHANLAALPPGRSPFAPPQQVAADAAPIDRLAALLGRRAG